MSQNRGPELKKQILKLQNKGMNSREIAERLNCNMSTVRYHWTRKNRNVPQLTEKQKTAIIKMYKLKHNATRVAKHFHINYPICLKVIRQAKSSLEPDFKIQSLLKQEQELEAKIAEIKAEKQRQIEAMRVHISRLSDNRIKISKESQALILSNEECALLANELAMLFDHEKAAESLERTAEEKTLNEIAVRSAQTNRVQPLEAVQSIEATTSAEN